MESLGKVRYPACAHIKRTQPKRSDEKEEPEYDVLPLYEKQATDNMFRKHYSLQTNELLKCRWKEYRDEYATRVFKPFQFPKVDDYHFYKCQTLLAPDQSLRNAQNFRKSLAPGPGVDQRGQKPIPNELHLIKTVSIKPPTKKGKTDKEKNGYGLKKNKGHIDLVRAKNNTNITKKATI